MQPWKPLVEMVGIVVVAVPTADPVDLAAAAAPLPTAMSLGGLVVEPVPRSGVAAAGASSDGSGPQEPPAQSAKEDALFRVPTWIQSFDPISRPALDIVLDDNREG